MVFGRYFAHATGLYGYGWLFQILILIVFFLIVYWVVIASQKKESAIEILNKRYSKGEISRKEYLSLKKDILSGADENGSNN